MTTLYRVAAWLLYYASAGLYLLGAHRLGDRLDDIGLDCSLRAHMRNLKQSERQR